MNIQHQPNVKIRCSPLGEWVVRWIDVNKQPRTRAFTSEEDARAWGSVLEEVAPGMGRCDHCGTVVFHEDYCKSCREAVKFWIAHEETTHRIAKHIAAKLGIRATCDQDVWYYLNTNNLYYQEVFAAAEELTCPSVE